MVSCLKCSNEEATYEYGPKYTSSEGSAVCDACVTSSYMIDGRCESKGNGVAQGGKEGMTLETLELEDGYFRFTSSSTEVYPCPYASNWYVREEWGFHRVSNGTHPTTTRLL